MPLSKTVYTLFSTGMTQENRKSFAYDKKKSWLGRIAPVQTINQR